MLLLAIIFMTLALLFYTYAVFSGRKHGLHFRQLSAFAIGLLFDYLGTHQMSLFARAYGKAPQLHNITGMLSLSGMAFHFLLALAATIAGRSEAANRLFHRVSLTIYSLWCVAFASGALFGSMKMLK